MNWKARYRKVKVGAICKPKPKKEWKYDYANDHFIHTLKLFTITRFSQHHETGDWWTIKESDFCVREDDIEVIR